MAIRIDDIKKEKTTDGAKLKSTLASSSIKLSKSKKKFSIKKKEKLFSELSVLLSSGIDLKSTLEIIVSQEEKKKEKELYQTIYDALLKGKTLSEAFQLTNMFSEYDFYSIQIGEEAGQVPKVLKDLTQYYNKTIKQQRQLVSAFTYPTIVVVTALISVVFMFNFVVPLFEDIFTRTESDLPAFTKFIIDVSDFFKEYTIHIFVFLALLIILFLIIRKRPFYKRFSTNLLLKLPIIGVIIKMIYLEKFFQSMELLLSAKVAILRSIQLVKKMINFYPFEEALTKMDNDILYGKSLYESMAKFNLFDKRVISLIKVGEEVNQLDSIFKKLNQQYSEELEHKITVMGNLLEPLLIIFVGVLVGVILVAMYLPMFKISTSVY